MMRVARRVSLLVAFSVLTSAATAYAESSCTDLSGTYLRDTDDGPVVFKLKQLNCSSLEINLESAYLGKDTTTKLSLKADGIFRWINRESHAGGAYMIAGRFVGNTFVVTSIPPFSSKSGEGDPSIKLGKWYGLRALSNVEVYSLDLNRNLRMIDRHYDFDGKLLHEWDVLAVRK